MNVCTFRPRQPHEKVSRWKLSKVSYNDEEKKAGIPVVPSLQPFKESNDSENKKSSLTSSTNPSMKRRKKAETVKLGEVYSDSSAMSGHKETKKSSSSSSKTEKHLFGISKRPKKKAEDAEEPNKIVPLTSVVTSSTNGLENTNENES